MINRPRILRSGSGGISRVTGYVVGMKFTIGFLAGGTLVAAWLRWWRPLAIAWWAQGH